LIRIIGRNIEYNYPEITLDEEVIVRQLPAFGAVTYTDMPALSACNIKECVHVV